MANYDPSIAPAAAEKLRERVIAELRTAFVSHCAKAISLAQALRLKWITMHGRRAAGAEYLINPIRGIAA